MNIKHANSFISKKIKNFEYEYNPFRTVTLAEILEGDTEIFNAPSQPSDSFMKAAEKAYLEFKEENRQIFLKLLPKANRSAADKLLELPEYTEELLPFFINHKPRELDYLYDLAKNCDLSGELRIPACTFPFFSEIPTERLKMLEPIISSKNDMGLWNYGPSFILSLDKCSDRQVEVMTKLAQCKVNGDCMMSIVSNPHLNWDKTVEKAQTLNKLYGKDLREISFFSNRNGENYITADIQLPHNDEKPDWLNFKRVFAKLDYDVNPVERMKSKAEIERIVDNIYGKWEKNLCLFTEKDLKKAVINIFKEVPDTNPQEILTVMQKLTQFSNYTSLKPLAEKLTEEKIISFVPDGELSKTFSYFHKFKKLFNLKDDNDGYFAYLITKNDIKNPERLKHLHSQINDERFSELNIKFINLEGWSDGVNLLGDDKKLEERTKKVLIKAKKIMNKQPKLTLQEAVEKYLNSGIEQTLKSMGKEVTTIRLEAPASKAVVLDQMKPYMPTKGLLQSTIETVAKHHTTSKRKFQKLCDNVAQYYEENNNIYTKQSIIENLRKINSNIENFVTENNIPKENVYFIQPQVPFTRKSFELITKMYQDLYNISDDKIKVVKDILDLNSYPPNSVFVVLDDVVGSGHSMIDVGQYEIYANVLGKDKHIIFAPITASLNGIKHIQKTIKAENRNGCDTVICPKENIINYRSRRNRLLNIYFSINKHAADAFGHYGYDGSGSCTAFPYMTPDNNSGLACDLIKFFLPDYKCIKNKTDLLSAIEEETYYYDVFGTDKEHVMTDAYKAYCPSSINSIIEYIKNIFH